MDNTQKHATMLDYAKTILPKVSFDRDLFRKELRKCISWVEKEQVDELYRWCNANFGKKFPEIIMEAFSNVAA